MSHLYVIVPVFSSVHVTLQPALSIRQSIRPSVCTSVRPSIHLSVCLSVCLSVRLSICPSVHLSIRLSICTVGWLVGCSVSLSLTFYFLGSGPKGADDLCFHIYGNFSFFSFFSYVRTPPQLQSPNSSPEAQILAVRPIFHPRDPNSNLEAQILALWPKF